MHAIIKNDASQKSARSQHSRCRQLLNWHSAIGMCIPPSTTRSFYFDKTDIQIRLCHHESFRVHPYVELQVRLLCSTSGRQAPLLHLHKLHAVMAAQQANSSSHPLAGHAHCRLLTYRFLLPRAASGVVSAWETWFLTAMTTNSIALLCVKAGVPTS